jgi:hypothetical protein
MRRGTLNRKLTFDKRDDPVCLPDLQQLVAKHGGYDKIGPEAWAEWDEQNVRFQTERRLRLEEERNKPRGGEPDSSHDPRTPGGPSRIPR